MANLDISIVMFALMVTLILVILGFTTDKTMGRVLFFLASLYGLATTAYFVQNYQVVSIGNLSFTIPFQIFLLSWVLLSIITPLILIVKK